MLNALRAWGKRHVPSSTQPTGERSRQTDQKARDDRASMVSKIREDIHRLQHEISDLNDTMVGDGIGSRDSAANDDVRMAKLHRELALKQQELGKYQARI